jgi:hypothetical protein
MRMILKPLVFKALHDLLLSDNNGSISALNVLLQFLFQELKDSGSVRHYIIRKMTIEFKELLTTKTIGKMIEKITARDFSLGTGCPILSNLKLETFVTDKTKTSIHEFSATFDVNYVDGFSISVDVDLILGRSAYVHIKIASIKGKMRMFFTRDPFTHWYLAFTEDPDIQFAVSSHFENKQIPQLTTLIINQLRRSVRKKHTLPNYKIRFKPFFDQMFKASLHDDMLDRSQVRETKLPTYISSSSGKLKINLLNFDHFSNSSLLQYHDSNIYMTIGVDALSLDYLLAQRTNINSWPKYEIDLVRQNLTDQIGITFVEIFFLTQVEVVVYKILQNTLAATHQSTLRQFDILVSINGLKVKTLSNAQRIIKNSLSLKMQFKRPQLFTTDGAENLARQQQPLPLSTSKQLQTQASQSSQSTPSGDSINVSCFWNVNELTRFI